MTNRTLAHDYYKKAKIRFKALLVLKKEQGHSDVVRESQELVELVLKGLLRLHGVEPPRWHDVSSILQEQQNKFPVSFKRHLNRIVQLSKYLRRERELSYYGDEDYLPTEEYTAKDSSYCIKEVRFLLKLVAPIFERSPRSKK